MNINSSRHWWVLTSLEQWNWSLLYVSLTMSWIWMMVESLVNHFDRSILPSSSWSVNIKVLVLLFLILKLSYLMESSFINFLINAMVFLFSSFACLTYQVTFLPMCFMVLLCLSFSESLVALFCIQIFCPLLLAFLKEWWVKVAPRIEFCYRFVKLSFVTQNLLENSIKELKISWMIFPQDRWSVTLV